MSDPTDVIRVEISLSSPPRIKEPPVPGATSPNPESYWPDWRLTFASPLAFLEWALAQDHPVIITKTDDDTYCSAEIYNDWRE